MSHPTQELLDELLLEFDDREHFLASMLVGSGARGELRKYSDLDLTFVSESPVKDDRSKYKLVYRRGRLISINLRSLSELEELFDSPRQAVTAMQVIRDSRILRDSDEVLEKIRRKALAFEWTAEFQKKAEREASYELMANTEELHKILKGLSENHELAMLAGAWGIALSMPMVIALKKGILSCGDNNFFRQVRESTGMDSNWTRYHEIACGARSAKIADCRLNQEALAAAHLYLETAGLCDSIIEGDDRIVVETAKQIAKASGLLRPLS